jgi:hypothetical protein
MNIRSIYCRLLSLYPAEFRKEFSQEMLWVFEQRAGEHLTNSKSVSFPFLLTEFSSIVKGAYSMRLKSIPSPTRARSSSNLAGPVELSPGYEETSRQHALAIQNMVAAIAKHDFAAARRYSDEEARLKHALRLVEHDASAASQETA